MPELMVAQDARRDQFREVLRANPALLRSLSPRRTKYWKDWRPNPGPQTLFLLVDHLREVLYGGAAGAGKSEALMMGALQYVDQPGYNALLLRRTISAAKLPGAILDRLYDWLVPWIRAKEIRFVDRYNMFIFPSGAKVVVGYIENEKDIRKYDSSEWHYVGYDELTQFSRKMYTDVGFGRQRRKAASRIPLRLRGATNPIGEGVDWVMERWRIDPKTDRGRSTPRRMFIPATLDDNPQVDRAAYDESLGELDRVTAAQLRHGRWGVRPAGGLFKREDFQIIDILPSGLAQVRFWDLASTDPQGRRGEGPDFTAGCRMARRTRDGMIVVVDMVRAQRSPAGIERIVRQTAAIDGLGVPVRMFQDPAQAGVAQIAHYAARVLAAYNFKGVRATGDKVTMATPLAIRVEQGQVALLRGAWNGTFLAEAEGYPLGHDDQIDAAGGAYQFLAGEGPRAGSASVPDFGRTAGAQLAARVRRANPYRRPARRPR